MSRKPLFKAKSTKNENSATQTSAPAAQTEQKEQKRAPATASEQKTTAIITATAAPTQTTQKPTETKWHPAAVRAPPVVAVPFKIRFGCVRECVWLIFIRFRVLLAKFSLMRYHSSRWMSSVLCRATCCILLRLPRQRQNQSTLSPLEALALKMDSLIADAGTLRVTKAGVFGSATSAACKCFRLTTSFCFTRLKASSNRGLAVLRSTIWAKLLSRTRLDIALWCVRHTMVSFCARSAAWALKTCSLTTPGCVFRCFSCFVCVLVCVFAHFGVVLCRASSLIRMETSSLQTLATGNFLCSFSLSPSLISRPRSRIQVCTRNGDFLRSWGAKGDEDGQLFSPHGLALNHDTGELFCADTSNHRICVRVFVFCEGLWGGGVCLVCVFI